MAKNSVFNVDYDHLRKISMFSQESFNYEGVSGPVSSLDDVFFEFERLVLMHPAYQKSGHYKIKEYLVNNYSSAFSRAINQDDSKKLVDLCYVASSVFVSKDLGFFSRKKQKYEFFNGLNSLIKEYKQGFVD
ncbi:MAG: hypothetical protein ACLFN8_00965 [Candidatus Woesearchaeota archaeon]